MPYSALTIVPKNGTDESNPHTIGIGWLKFNPFFGTLQSPLLKGHMAKKDIPLFPPVWFLRSSYSRTLRPYMSL